MTAFTLAELLVVIGIIGLLLSLLLPSLAAARATSQSLACAARLRELGQGMAIYAIDNHGYLLPHAYGGQSILEPRWVEAVMGEEHGHAPNGDALTDILVCPSDPYDGNPPGQGVAVRNSYLINTYVTFTADIGRLGDNNYGIVPSEAVLLGEKRPDVEGWYLFSTHWDSGLSDWEQVDLKRHGERLRSNHLFLDLHVSNVALVRRSPEAHPWIPRVNK